MPFTMYGSVHSMALDVWSGMTTGSTVFAVWCTSMVGGGTGWISIGLSSRNQGSLTLHLLFPCWS